MDRETQKAVLKWLLGQAYRAEEHKQQLTERLERIRAEMRAPMAVKYNQMPRAKKTGEGAAEYVLKLEEIEEKIMEQISAVAEAKMKVMEIIAYIPVHEPARQIMELRHIDMKDWYQIGEQMYMSRQQCGRYYRGALEALLEYKEIMGRVKKAEEDYIIWQARRPAKRRRKPRGQKTKVGT